MAPPTKPVPTASPAVQTSQEYNAYNVGPSTAASPIAVLGYILRLLSVVLTIVAAIVMGTGKQTSDFYLNGDPVNGTLKPSSGSAFKFFIAANVIACVYAIASLVLAFLSQGGGRNLRLALTIVDLLTACLLFASNGAASAVAVIARNGEGLWDKVCDIFGKVCGQVAASITLSMAAALAFLLLVLFSVLAMHNRTP